jgi:hypothetical protein
MPLFLNTLTSNTGANKPKIMQEINSAHGEMLGSKRINIARKTAAKGTCNI